MTVPSESRIIVPWSEGDIIISLTTPPEGIQPTGYALLLGPGANGNENTLLLRTMAMRVAQRGHLCARYHTNAPSPAFRVALVKRVIEHVFHRNKGSHPAQRGIFLGGHSLGSRVACTVAVDFWHAHLANSNTEQTQGAATTTLADPPHDFIRGLVLTSFPISTPDSVEPVRPAALLDVPPTLPTLCFSGVTDIIVNPVVLNNVFAEMKSSPRQWYRIEGGVSHGLEFTVPTSEAGTQAEVARSVALEKTKALVESIADLVIAFMDPPSPQCSKTEEMEQAVVSIKQIEVRKTANVWDVAISNVV